MKPEFLWELAAGGGLSKETLDQRGRDYLVRILASRPGDEARLCRIEGVRWLSPSTLFFEAVNDLAAHSDEQMQAVREFLALSADLQEPDAQERLRQVCVALSKWLSGCGLRLPAQSPIS